MVVVVSPDRVVIGGGVAAAGDLLFEPIREELRRRVWTTSLAEVEVVPAELGTWAGAIGAAIHGAEAAAAAPWRMARRASRPPPAPLRSATHEHDSTVLTGRLVLADRVEAGRITVDDGWITPSSRVRDGERRRRPVSSRPGSSTSTSTAGAATTRWASRRRSTGWPAASCAAA